MDKKRKIKDGILNTLTYLSSSITFIVLVLIVVFIFVKGSGNLSFKMLVSNYYETPYYIENVSPNYNGNLTDSDNTYYSKNYGIGLSDTFDLEKNKVIEVVYIDEASPLKENSDFSVGKIINRVQVKKNGVLSVNTSKMGAESIRDTLDNSDELIEIYFLEIGGGIRGSLISTLYLILFTLLFALPLGIIAAIYLSLYAKKNKLTDILRALIDMISGIPSIIFGLVSLIIIIPFVNSMTGASGGSIIAGSLTMAIMLLPTVIRTTEEAINRVPKGYISSSLALGASYTETIFKVVLPNALPGVFTACILCIGRIIGESAALIFAIGSSIQDSISVNSGSTTLAVHIWSVIAGENPNFQQACAISIIILIIVLILNILVKLISLKLNRFEVKK